MSEVIISPQTNARGYHFSKNEYFCTDPKIGSTQESGNDACRVAIFLYGSKDNKTLHFCCRNAKNSCFDWTNFIYSIFIAQIWTYALCGQNIDKIFCHLFFETLDKIYWLPQLGHHHPHQSKFTWWFLTHSSVLVLQRSHHSVTLSTPPCAPGRHSHHRHDHPCQCHHDPRL